MARRPAESGRLVVRASLTSHSQLTAETLAKGHSWFSPLNLRSYSANAKLAVCAPALVSLRVRSARCVAGAWCVVGPLVHYHPSLRAYLRRLTLESLPSTILTLLKPANTRAKSPSCHAFDEIWPHFRRASALFRTNLKLWQKATLDFRLCLRAPTRLM